VGLAAFALIGGIRANPRLVWSFLGASAALLVWAAALLRAARRQRRTLILEFVVRRQHYLQAFVQTSIFVYWGWYWRVVYDSAHLIVAQLVFAYAFDMLLSWSRRDVHTLGFGPFPVVFSTNVFLWFKPDWFYFQFMMIALGFVAKEVIRWDKDGRRTHIFNPSSLALAVFSVLLIFTGRTALTWGPEIAITQFYPPHIYLFLFLLGLPGQFFFGVTSMTMSAVVTTYLFGLAYFAATGTYFFVDSYIPISIFLGMHFLFTDPSTAPRSELGRIIFGMLYGLSSVALYEVLGRSGLPTFYDKLLQIPLLNLMIQVIDRAARSKAIQRIDPSNLVHSLVGRRRNLAYMAVWTIVFTIVSAAQGVGDFHRGQYLPFWEEACRNNRRWACSYLSQLEANFCQIGSGWACNELGILKLEREPDSSAAGKTALESGCRLGFDQACYNLNQLSSRGTLVTGHPTLDDYPILLRGSKGPLTDLRPSALYVRACRQGWAEGCGQVSTAQTERQ
jgi:hypothetical protein